MSKSVLLLFGSLVMSHQIVFQDSQVRSHHQLMYQKKNNHKK